MVTLNARGFELAYDVVGEAGSTAPLVWGHGLTSSRGIEAAFPLVDLTSVGTTRQVVRYDARGHGMSSPLDDPTKGSWAELALDQLALIEHLGFDRVALGGVSMGVGTALHSAVTLGDRLDRMVLVIPPTGWLERAPQIALYEQMARVVEARGARALLAASAEMPPPDPFVATSTWADHRVASLGGTDPARLAANFRGAAHADLPDLDVLATIGAPTLVLAWSGDPGHPVSTAERLGETLADVTVSVASTAAQFATWTDQVTAFLATA